jgi:hypothetical protein
MTEAPIKQVRLSEAWELPPAIAETVMNTFKTEFANGEIVAYGLRVSSDGGQKIEDRIAITSPLDYIINWIGTRPRVGDNAVAAHRRERRRPIEAFFDIERGSSTDVFEDLTIAKPDWERLCNAARKWIREWINMVFADPRLASADLQVLTAPFNDVEPSGRNVPTGDPMAADPGSVGRVRYKAELHEWLDDREVNELRRLHRIHGAEFIAGEFEDYCQREKPEVLPLLPPIGAQMPYISKAQRESAKWLELPELVKRVRATDGCSVEDAHAQIRAALRDGAISSLRWHPVPASIPSSGGGVRLPAFAPPGADDHWLTVKIDWERSRVFDTFDRAKRKLLLIDRRRDRGDWEPANFGNLQPPPRSIWRHLTLDRGSCESTWPTPQPPNPEQQTPWPADRDTMSIKEAAALLEPYCPPRPLVQRYEAIAREREKQLEEAKKERRRLKDAASLDSDFDAFARVDALFKCENSDDPTLKVDIVKIERLSELCSDILLIAEMWRVPLISSGTGMYTNKPNADCLIDREGFEKIRSVLLSHGKWATLPVVCSEPRGGSAVKSTISLIEAVHELRSILDLPIRSAISGMIDRVATGQLPPASAVIDGEPTIIDPRWWWGSPVIEYPNSAVTFNLLDNGKPRPIRATEISLNLSAWDRLKTSIAAEQAAPQVDGAEKSAEPHAKLVDRLARWIFDQHPIRGVPKPQDALLDLAKNEFEGGFEKTDFRTAYQLVYDTKRGRPRITGWPLKEPYKSRFLAQGPEEK